MSATVSINQGKLEGDDQDGLFVFKGVPYAAPPLVRADGSRPRSPGRGQGCATRAALARWLIRTR